MKVCFLIVLDAYTIFNNVPRGTKLCNMAYYNGVLLHIVPRGTMWLYIFCILFHVEQLGNLINHTNMFHVEQFLISRSPAIYFLFIKCDGALKSHYLALYI